jgi:CheY-like chemotaxis protein
LTNAVKYTETGTITLDVDFVNRSKSQIDLKISVKDTGRGIKKTDINKLFTSFQRLEEAHNKNIEGTGLGLAIVGGYVKLMHGKIDVLSDYGKGSEFIVTIPQKVVKHDEIGEFDFKFNKPAAKTKNYKPSFKAPKAKVLAVDDNNMNLVVVKNLLKSTEIRIDLAHSGQECLDKVRNEFYDVILLDHMMPEMDGTECLRILKDQKLINKTPVIALTANALSGAKEEYMRLGFDDYLSKPIVPLELENMLKHWLPGWLIEMPPVE